MALVDTLIRWVTGRPPSERGQTVHIPQLPWPPDLFTGTVNFNGRTYGLNTTYGLNDHAPIGTDFKALVDGAYKANGIIYAAVQARLMLLSQARFQFQQMRGGVPGDLFGNESLSILERPEPGKVTADLLARASVDVDLAGNHFVARRGTRLKRLRPDWVDIILGSNGPVIEDARDIDAEVVGYVFYPGGRYSGLDPEILLADEVAHLAPIPDPIHRYRGMSWLTPITGEVMADQAAQVHKLEFFRNGATVNLVVSLDIPDPTKFAEFVDKMDQQHQGLANAYKTLYLGAGANATAVGANMQQMEFTAMQGKAETRIAMASGVHPVILGASEGLAGSSLNQGNFMAARRLVADMTLRPWWGSFASSLEVLVPPPPGSRLWYDDRHIPFLAEDVKDAAEVQNKQATTIRQLVDAGFEAGTVVEAVSSSDWSRLVHTGLFSVQLQPPMPEGPPEPAAPPEEPSAA